MLGGLSDCLRESERQRIRLTGSLVSVKSISFSITESCEWRLKSWSNNLEKPFSKNRQKEKISKKVRKWWDDTLYWNRKFAVVREYEVRELIYRFSYLSCWSCKNMQNIFLCAWIIRVYHGSGPLPSDSNKSLHFKPLIICLGWERGSVGGCTRQQKSLSEGLEAGFGVYRSYIYHSA